MIAQNIAGKEDREKVSSRQHTTAVMKIFGDIIVSLASVAEGRAVIQELARAVWVREERVRDTTHSVP